MFLPSCVGKGGKPERLFSEEFLCGALDKQHIIAARKGGEGIAPQPIWGKSQYGPGNTRLGEGGKHLADGQLLRRENFPQKEGAPWGLPRWTISRSREKSASASSLRGTSPLGAGISREKSVSSTGENPNFG